MADLYLASFGYAPWGAFGIMMVADAMIFTVERPWLDNQPYISCIPEGVYECSPRHYFRGGYEAIEIREVPNRSYILFHRANLPSDVAGCIAPVSTLGCLNGQWAGLNSRVAFDRLMRDYGGKTFELSIGHRPEFSND